MVSLGARIPASILLNNGFDRWLTISGTGYLSDITDVSWFNRSTSGAFAAGFVRAFSIEGLLSALHDAEYH